MNRLIDTAKNAIERLGITEYSILNADDMFVILDDIVHCAICCIDYRLSEDILYVKHINDIYCIMPHCYADYTQKAYFMADCIGKPANDTTQVDSMVKLYADSRKAYLETINALQEQLKDLDNMVKNAREFMNIEEFYNYTTILSREIKMKAKQIWTINLTLK